MGAEIRVGVTCASIEGLDARPIMLEATMGTEPGDVTIEDVDSCQAEGLITCVRQAMDNCGFEWPQLATTVRLRPTPDTFEQTCMALPLAAALIALTSDNAQNLEIGRAHV